jgi:hypothetical protein
MTEREYARIHEIFTKIRYINLQVNNKNWMYIYLVIIQSSMGDIAILKYMY